VVASAWRVGGGEEAIRNIRDAAEAYIRDMQSNGEQVPTNLRTQVVDKPVVAITI